MLSLVVAALQDQADGSVLQTVAVFEVQVTSIGNSIAGQREEMPGERPDARGVRLDDDLSPEVSHLDARVRLPREGLRDAIGRGRDSGALSGSAAVLGGHGEHDAAQADGAPAAGC
ncbi:hypothetical protein AB0B42_00830 [Streptomyces fradiae]|uniref:hypothetical protein n=1 Tax=Streptomyces fradiae TaxID=1906 RepID=UPI0033C03631